MTDRLWRVLSRRPRKTGSSLSAPAADWRTTLRKRVTVAGVVLALWVVGIEARLVYLQVVAHADLDQMARRQQMRTIPLAAKRGDILDRRGRVLATGGDADSIYAVPSALEDEKGTVNALCNVFGDCTAKERQELIDRLGKQRNFAYIRRHVAPGVARDVAALNLDGIGLLKESRRFYPNKELAAHLLGFVGLDNKGLSGIESAYDSQIRGKEGQILVYADARHRAFNRFEKPPTSGSTLELTIDEFLQHTAERELHAGVVENRAAGGSAIIMDPRTGEILAMANEPTFNPNTYRDATVAARRNRAVQDLYEPGSTFKVVTASAAIEEHLFTPDEPIDASGGSIRFGSRVVNDTHDYGVLSFTDVIVKSSNVGAIRIGLKLGPDRFSDYVERFGFGRPISPDFPSESPGIVWNRTHWTDSALASVSMGYQVGVTPLQMAAAVSAVANGGELVEPRVVRAAYHDDRRFNVRPKVLRRTISRDTATQLTTIMEGVVERGTATIAQIPGYTVAGKTGTANKLFNGRYSSDTYASFVGFLPSRDPKVTIIVVLDSPRGKNGHFGGPVSAPIFRRIAEATLRYMGVAPSIDPAPPVLIVRQDEGLKMAGTSAMDAPPVPAFPSIQAGTIPDVLGLSARDAMRALVSAGFTAQLSGDGVVVSQDPPAGESPGDRTVCLLTLARLPLAQPSDSSLP